MGAKARPATVRLTKRRHLLVWVLIVLASLLALVCTLTLWVNRQMLDNDAWNKASAQVIRDPKVQAALSAFLVNQLYNNVNVPQALEQRLPPNLKQLGEPLAAALRPAATNAAEQLLARPRVQQLFITATTTAHQKLVNVLENKTGFGVETGNGVVTVNLHGLLTELGAELGISSKVLDRVPQDAGVLTIMRSDQLSAAQKGVRLIKILSVWLLVIVLAVYALAIWLAHGARRETLRDVGWALAVVGLILLLVRRVVGNYALDALTSPTYRGTVHDVWLIGTSILGQIGVATVVYGLIAVAGALLAGPTRAATVVRGHIAPTLNERPGIAAGALGGVFLLVVLWGPTHALRTWWGVLLLGGLLAVGLLALRRQTKLEFGVDDSAAEGDAPAAGAAAAAPE